MLSGGPRGPGRGVGASGPFAATGSVGTAVPFDHSGLVAAAGGRRRQLSHNTAVATPKRMPASSPTKSPKYRSYFGNGGN